MRSLGTSPRENPADTSRELGAEGSGGTERELEASLRERERELKEAHRIARLGTWRWVKATNELTWSEEVFRIYGLDPEGPVPREAETAKMMSVESYQRILGAIHHCFATGEPYEMDLDVRHASGETCWILARGEVGAWGENGEVLELRGTVQDITERKRTELALDEHERLLVEAHRLARLGTWRWNVLTDETVWSKEVAQIFGQDPLDKALGYEAVMALHRPESAALLKAAVEALVTEGRPYELDLELELADGSRRWIVGRGAVMNRGAGGEVVLVGGTIQDITERKRMELELRERERELEESQRLNRVGRWSVHVPSGEVWWSREVYAMFGADPDGGVVVPPVLEGLFLDGSYAEMDEAFERLKRRGVPYKVDAEIEGLDGERRWICARGEVSRRNAEGEILELRGTIQDISERKAVEAALRESERRFRELANSLPELVWEADAQGKITYLNEQFLEYSGLDLEKMVGGDAAGMVHPEDRERTMALWRRCHELGIPYENELRMRRYDGEYHYFLGRAVPVFDEHGRVKRWLGTATDVQNQKTAEQSLRRTEKLAVTGRLAASIAHEINNPLEAVTNALYLALQSERLENETREYLKMADRELQRVAHVATQTLRFHRQQRGPAAEDLSELMETALTLFEGRLNSAGVCVEREYKCMERLHCSGDELRQVFANLLSNALDATRKGGKLRVRISKGRRWEQEAAEGLRVSIGDTGHGIPEELRTRIFEPFMTTKDATGTGLGLWVSAGIVQKHGGTVRLKSRVGRGTVFSLFFPKVMGEAAGATKD